MKITVISTLRLRTLAAGYCYVYATLMPVYYFDRFYSWISASAQASATIYASPLSMIRYDVLRKPAICHGDKDDAARMPRRVFFFLFFSRFSLPLLTAIVVPPPPRLPYIVNHIISIYDHYH